MAGFWKAPRSLAALLTTRGLSPTEFTLLVFLGISGADRPEGFATTNQFLADSIGVSDKTLRRALRGLRARGFVEFEDHQGVPGFTARTSVTLWEPLREPLRSFETPSVTEVASVTTSVTTASAEGRDPAPEAGSEDAATSVTTSVTSRARAETETDTDTEKRGSPSRDAADLVEHYLRGLGNTIVPQQVRRQIAEQISGLLTEEVPPELIADALDRLAGKNLPPSMLPSLVVDVQREQEDSFERTLQRAADKVFGEDE